ncbi:AGC/DMPK/ROCK protein kinase [Sphaeroforma arctica JP610]|uniref:AGC/DMPK/ROCK protein kinase n=1 Tax=Sphaeroforma arctica JP610 TaxID=667725 RepID=A0A0L0FZ85_9EUKA|nr:AGC/DMPK/ROCK protein kinase [Sphaeroforma arctica JP610]KNC81283.1 AGC/DMPK/ROCK protein kinase [Sphaeroforma arctica JP610]|eukprot:XP_014155185.1 AGC/DMPK/ROCK protein kinase [Sphaeroforma arctica JP610]
MRSRSPRPGGAPTDLSHDEIQQLFQTFDTDGDHKVTPDELQIGLFRLGHSTVPGFVHHIFEQADTDGDGGIDIHEFKIFWEHHNAQLKRIFDMADVASTGEITTVDLERVMRNEGIKAQTKNELTMMMKKVDKDGNGGVSYNEFREYFMFTPLTNTNEILKFWQRPALVGDDGRMKEIVVPLNSSAAGSATSLTTVTNAADSDDMGEDGTATAYGNGKIGYVVCKFIDSGAFGEVSLVECQQTGMSYALKRFSQEDADVLAQYLEEREFFNALNSRPEALKRRSKLVQMYDSFISNDMSCLLLSYVPGGNLESWIENRVFNEESALFYFAEAAAAVHEIHTCCFVHRDIKPSQFLLEGNGRLKLCDFGSCVRVSEDGLVRAKVQIGTTDYMSPEVIRARRRTQPFPSNTDWWSLGIVLYQMLFGYLPFESTNEAITQQLILGHETTLRLSDPNVLPDGLSDDCKDLILGLLTETSQRLSYEDITVHPALSGVSECFSETETSHEPVSYIASLQVRDAPAISPKRLQRQRSAVGLPLRGRPPPRTNFSIAPTK